MNQFEIKTPMFTKQEAVWLQIFCQCLKQGLCDISAAHNAREGVVAFSELFCTKRERGTNESD